MPRSLSAGAPTCSSRSDAPTQSAEDFSRTFDFLHELRYKAHYLEADLLHPCDASVQSKVPPVTNYVFLPR